MSHAAVFLDRDGVLNVAPKGDWVRRVEGFHWLPGAKESVRRLNDAGFVVALVTNQSGVGRGLISLADVEAIHQKMVDDLAGIGARLNGIFMCPHEPTAGCRCRKPKPGLFEQAVTALDIDLSKSVMVGDSVTDMTAARAAGVGVTLAVRSGLAPADEISAWQPAPDAVFDDLAGAVDWILGDRDGL